MADKKTRTLRSQRANEKTSKKPRRLSAARSKVSVPLRKATSRGKNKLPKIKLPDNKLGRLLKKVFGPTINYFVESWKEIRKVTWPTRRETLHLSLAVFIFAAVLTAVVAVLDFGLDKVFREIIIQ